MTTTRSPRRVYRCGWGQLLFGRRLPAAYGPRWFGGSLGYAQTTDPFPVDGILGGHLGVGFDEYGNFGNNLEGRGAGCNQPDSGFYPN